MAKAPCFPSEVWLAIFDWATFVPFSLDTHPPNPFGYPRTSSHHDIRNSIRESMCTKRHLILVCREWRTLATCFLYRSIIITRSKTSEKLLCALSSHLVGKELFDPLTPAKPNGQWVARIDVLLPKEDFFPEDVFPRLLSSTPNLQILVVSPACGDPYRRIYFNEVLSLFNALAEKLAPSLRVLDIDGSLDHGALQPLKIIEAINGRPLRSLTFHSENFGEAILDLSNIEHLNVPDRLTDALLIARDLPPSLISLSLTLKHATMKHLVEGQILYAREGIDTLAVIDHVPDHVPDHTPDQQWSLGPSEPLLHHIAAAFPSLRRLIIRVYFALFAKYLPPVEKLGLYVGFFWTSEDHEVKWWETLCATIERLVAITPTVQVVRLFHRVSRDDLTLRCDRVVRIVRKTSAALLLKHKVRFEDVDGRLLHLLETA